MLTKLPLCTLHQSHYKCDCCRCFPKPYDQSYTNLSLELKQEELDGECDEIAGVEAMPDSQEGQGDCLGHLPHS